MSRGELVITVHSATDLKHPSSIGRSNPYVKLILSEHQHFKTESKSEQVTPSFEQSFSFRITGVEQSLKIELKLQGIFSASISSTAELPIQQLLSNGMHTVRLTHEGRDAGILTISSNFTPDPNQFNSMANQSYAQPIAHKEQPPVPSFNPAYASPDAPPPYEATAFNASPSSASGPPPQYQQPYQPSQFQQSSASQQFSPPPQQYQQPSPQHYRQPSPAHQYRQPSPQHYPSQPAQPFNQFPYQAAGAGWPQQQPFIHSPPAQVVVVNHPPFGSKAKLFGHPHHLEHRKHVYRGTYECNNCRRSCRGPVWHCEIDNYDVCPQCFLQMSQPCVPCTPCTPAIPVMPHVQPVQAYKDARHPHLLTLSSNLYPNSVKPGHFRCDSCQKPGHGQAFHCSTCSYDLHPSCFRQG